MYETLEALIAANSEFIGTDGSDIDVAVFTAFAERSNLFNGNPDFGSIGSGDNYRTVEDKLNIDLVVGSFGRDVLRAEADAVIVTGPGNDSVVAAGSAIFGGPGNDYLSGADSFVHGGPGRDTFVPADGMMVADFGPADSLNFFGIAFGEDIDFTSDGKGNTLVDYQRDGPGGGAERMTLLGVDPGDIDPDSILAYAVADDYPADDTTTGVIELDGSVTSGALETSDDFDWFRVDLPAGEQYRFDFSSEIFLNVDVYNSESEEVINYSDSGFSWVEHLNLMSEDGGTYYIAVSAWQSSSGFYDIYATPGDSSIVEII